MNKFRILAAAAALMAGQAMADGGNIRYDHATVLESTPVFRTVKVSTPRRECWQETVVYRDHHDRDRRRDHGLGTVLGGVVGGAIGNAVGHKKRNKQVGAVVGAVVGATVGNAIAHNTRAKDRGYRGDRYGTEEVCEVYDEYHEEQRIIGYDVRYRYYDQTFTTRMETEPGDTIKVRLAVTPASY